MDTLWSRVQNAHKFLSYSETSNELRAVAGCFPLHPQTPTEPAVRSVSVEKFEELCLTLFHEILTTALETARPF